MKTSAWSCALCLVVLMTVESGCSFFMSTVPDDYQPQELPGCSDSNLAPIMDTLQAISGLVAGGLYLALSSGSSDNSMFKESYQISGYTGLISGAVYGGAAVLGYSRASRCEAAKNMHENWNRQQILVLEAKLEAAKENSDSSAAGDSR